MNNEAYRIEVEVAPMEGTQLPSDCAGAYVNVYVAAKSIREAIDLVGDQLLSDCYKPIKTTAAYELDIDDGDYPDVEEGYPDKEDVENLCKTGGYWYGPFYTFSAEDSHKH